MSQIRLNPISKRPVIYTSIRESKPSDLWDRQIMNIFSKFDDVEYSYECPFCKGNEHMTPQASFVDGDLVDWKVRAVPNLYPIIKNELEIKNLNKYCYVSTGMHDVIVESPIHNKNYFNIDKEQFELIYELIHKRFKEHIKNPDVSYVSLFKNYKMLAGASMQHSHSQIISLDACPVKLTQEIEQAIKEYKEDGKCIVCKMIEYELSQNTRVIYQNEDFVVLEPYAPGYKFETWIMPKKHQPYFEKEENIKSLSEVIYTTFKMLYKAIGDFPFNMYLNYLVKGYSGYEAAYHYYFKIVPKLSGGAGFEMASGIRVNSIIPEDAAQMIKRANNI
ncbi:DUF4921 family protein [Criibacterium bergeronii]|uniref:DUF4921 family protein n=1 Tax=Criibacterium bergeronii TaxID=1871336 RepID=A0A552VDX3_9FIRM|nr:DUF4931 domain-containing protein [Criibacterium bergeronii]TRW28675.1 DUF4921 family protein [Criibacterium bergeronii]